MPYHISTSQFSFLQFSESDIISACNWPDTEMCLPVFQSNDVAFQFVIAADTEEEADVLCSIDSNPVVVGHVEACSDALTPFTGTVTRYRIAPLQILYYWSNGITTLNTMEIGQCFKIGIEVFEQFFCSNCFQRIGSDCHTSVVEFYGDENAFGYNYCAGESVDEDATDCEPLILQFTNQSSMVIPWTAYLESIYGQTPSINVWTYDGSELVQAGQVVKYDTFPPTEIRIDFGGVNSGIIKITR